MDAARVQATSPTAAPASAAERNTSDERGADRVRRPAERPLVDGAGPGTGLGPVRTRLITSAITIALFVMTACGGGGTDRETAIADLQNEVGMTEAQAACAVGALEDRYGSLDFVSDPDALSDADAAEAGLLILDCMGSSNSAAETLGDGAESQEPGESAEAAPEPTATASVQVPTEPPEPQPADEPDPAEPDPSPEPADAGEPSSNSGASSAIAVGDPALQGAWGVAQLCTLFDPSAVTAAFSLEGVAIVDEQYEDSEVAVCSWNDPADASLAPRGIVKALQEPAGGFVQLEEPVDIPGAANVDHRPDFLPGRDFLVVEANGQILQLDYLSATVGSLEFVSEAATRWVAAQNGEPYTPGAAAGEGAGEQAATDGSTTTEDSASGELSPDSQDPGEIPELARYWSSCGNGDPDACDYLYMVADEGSAYHEFGASCGGREIVNCQELLGDEFGSLRPTSELPGTDQELDALWLDCAAGSGSACDDLYFASPIDSKYQWFGFTCGGRGAYVDCDEAVARYGS